MEPDLEVPELSLVGRNAGRRAHTVRLRRTAWTEAP